LNSDVILKFVDATLFGLPHWFLDHFCFVLGSTLRTVFTRDVRSELGLEGFFFFQVNAVIIHRCEAQSQSLKGTTYFDLFPRWRERMFCFSGKKTRRIISPQFQTREKKISTQTF
jgi:hypothetical protein